MYCWLRSLLPCCTCSWKAGSVLKKLIMYLSKYPGPHNNYETLILLLTRSIKAQQQQIDELKTLIGKK